MTTRNLFCIFAKFKGGNVMSASVGKAAWPRCVAAVLTFWECDSLNKEGYLMQWPEIGWEGSQKPWRSLPSVPWTLHQCSISLNNSFKFSLSVLVQLLWLLFFPDRCFSVKGVVAKFPEKSCSFPPFPRRHSRVQFLCFKIQPYV